MKIICNIVWFVVLAALTQNSLASPSGLNNIPTADTTPDQTAVLQAYTNLNDDRDDDYMLGVKVGFRPWNQKIELGVDGRLGENANQFAIFQIKYALDLNDIFGQGQSQEQAQGQAEGFTLPTVAIGVANFALTEEDRREAGQPMTYMVLSHDWDLFRIHAGYGLQHKNNAAFFGIDRTFPLFERDFTLRADAIQIDDQDQWLGSVGFMYQFDKHWAIESWVSQPFDQGDASFTIKLNFIIPF